jgi:hypothetical protein
VQPFWFKFDVHYDNVFFDASDNNFDRDNLKQG